MIPPHARLGCLSFVLAVALAGAFGCETSSGAGPSSASSSSGSSETAPLFEIPRGWEIIEEKNEASVYQANLENQDGAGRILVGRLALDGDIRDLEVYLHKLHGSLVDRIRGRADVAPFARDRLQWSNDMIGYRTKLRGELGDRAVVLEGITLSDGDYAYFHYGLFPESAYQSERPAYRALLRSFRPLQGAERRDDETFDLDEQELAREGKSATGPGNDSATSPNDYLSPKTHLGVVPWGTTRKDVIATEGKPLRKRDRAIAYRCEFAGLEKCLVIYIFTFGKLTHGAFVVGEEYDQTQKYVSNYLRLTKKLSRKFGRPSQSSAIWKNPKYKDQGDKWGKALAADQVLFGTVWQLGPTKVVHVLRNPGGEGIRHRILMSNERLRKKLQKNVQAKR